MTTYTRSVVIPLAGPAKASGRVAIVQADNHPPQSNDAQLNPAIAELADWRLYGAGSVALAAIRRLNIRPPPYALHSRFIARKLDTYLTVANGTEILGLQENSSRSAELGLALAFLLHAGRSNAKTIIATGALSRELSVDEGETNDVAILPVDGIESKIAAIARTLDETSITDYPNRVMMFVPVATSDGKPTLDVHKHAFSQLVQLFKAKNVALEIHPVASLNQALSVLRISSLTSTKSDKIAASALAACMVVAALTLSGYLWLSAPIGLRFESITSAVAPNSMTPVRAKFIAAGERYTILARCQGPRQLPAYKDGDTLVARIATEELLGQLDTNSSYRFTVVVASEQSGVKVFPDSVFFGRKTGIDTQEGVTLAIPIQGPKEENKLVIIAQRLLAFDNNRIRKDLTKIAADGPASELINRVVNHLSEQAPGYLDYSFLSIGKDESCQS